LLPTIMAIENRRRTFRVNFPADTGPRAELCPFGADESAPLLAGRVVDLSYGGAAVLLAQEVPTAALDGPWVAGIELPGGPGVSTTLILTCTVSHRRRRPDGALYGLRFPDLDQPIHAAQREALQRFLAERTPPEATANGSPSTDGPPATGR
jgi:c-di-GMP-binding flagellar brake protein YcgR